MLLAAGNFIQCLNKASNKASTALLTLIIIGGSGVIKRATSITAIIIPVAMNKLRGKL